MSALRQDREFRLQDLQTLDIAITQLASDSRSVQPGDTFVAYPGLQADGRDHIAQALERGANAVLWEAGNFRWNPAWKLPNLGVPDLRRHAGAIADQVYGHPSQKLWMIGVTGTNGKTSITHWLARMLEGTGRKTALLGTLGNGFPGELQATQNTTPDVLLLHRLLGEYVRQGATAAAMEVSSHALTQGRVNGVRFDVALMTNLTRDHLDYHGDMQSYAAAKRRLFQWPGLKYAVVNLDDAFGMELAEQLQETEIEVVGYGLSTPALKLAERMGLRMVYGILAQSDAQGLVLQLHTSWGAAALHSKLIGRFNASNLLGALSALLVSDVSIDSAVHELSLQKAVVGRMQNLGIKDKPSVVVDYAHTPDALEKVLGALREVTAPVAGRLICVFGCGGDRDRGKRQMMGRVASTLSDLCIITSDNPRNEEPQAIIDEIVQGVQGEYRVIEDRARAIQQAIGMARVNDTVLLAGKGHEGYQEIRGERIPFLDSEIAHRALSMWTPAERWQ